MKKSLLISSLCAFLFLFVGIGCIIGASLTTNIGMMYFGLSSLILGSIGYTILLILFFYQYK
ncbi:MAG: hypothetical protein K2N65_03405, partial [Anaeroplasmataceae bacterium]|nr:hypothetical protein [Anaeroplasmataceae bacterium]